ncbi:hypothetical protein ACFW04_000800 [Cataglyphis niger]
MGAYRPICLLDEAGKMLERIIANCLVQYLREVKPDLRESQYGFREERSIVDAILRMTLAMSLDIAFNTLPWGHIREALEQGLSDPLMTGFGRGGVPPAA